MYPTITHTHVSPPPLHTTYDEMIGGLLGWDGTMEMEIGGQMCRCFWCAFAKKKTTRNKTRHLCCCL